MLENGKAQEVWSPQEKYLSTDNQRCVASEDLGFQARNLSLGPLVRLLSASLAHEPTTLVAAAG